MHDDLNPASVAPEVFEAPFSSSFSGPRSAAIVWRDIQAVLRRRFWLIALTPVVTLGAAVALVLLSPSVYRATAVLRLGDARRALTTGLEAPAEEVGRLVDPLLSELQLLRSRSLVGQVVDSLGLRLDPKLRGFTADGVTGARVAPEAAADTLQLAFSSQEVVVRGRAGSARAAYGQPVELGGVRFTIGAAPTVRRATWIVRAREAAIDRVLEDLRVVPRPQTSVVDLRFTSERREVAQHVVNTLAQAFQEEDARNARQQSGRRRVFLEEQLRRTDSLLARAQLALSRFRSQQQVYSSRDKLAAQQQDLMTLQGRRADLEGQRSLYRALLPRLQSTDAGERQDGLRALAATPGATANPFILQLATQLARYRSSLDSLTTGAYGVAQSNPDVGRLRDLIASTESQLASAVAGQVLALDAQLSALEGQRARSGSDIRALPALEAEEVRLSQEVETSRGLADQLRQEHQRAQMAEAVEVGRVEIIDFAALPYAPLPPLKTLKLALGLLLGLVIGVGGAFGLEALSSSLRRREDIEDVLHFTPLAVIPSVAKSGNGHSRLPWRRSGPTRLPAITATSLPPIGAEAFRVLRTNLLHSQRTRGLRTVAITSPAPGDGKTTTAANLATALGAEGLRVLLIDADLWHGRMHELLGVRRVPGLAECLVDGRPASTVAVPTFAPGLSLLTCGSEHQGAADLLAGGRMRALLTEAREQYDLVLLDTPPVLGVSDARVLATLVDGVVLVVRTGRTHRDAVEESVRQLALVGARLVGAVLNDPAGVTEHYGDYYYAYAREVVDE